MVIINQATAYLLSVCLTLGACTTNPATGQSQFTGLMPASQEASVGASEHQKALAQYGVYDNQNVQNYVRSIGEKIVPFTERKDVNYTFTVLDSPVINAFALPGGYVYVTRGLMAWANSEAELAGVMAHEIGHVNARHSAARYSQSVAAQLGLSVLGAVTSTPSISQAASLGTNLYLAQYSQSQEYESDSLGIRYLSRAGYDPKAMSGFLQQLNREKALSGGSNGAGFFASHPSTPARVQRSSNEAASVQVPNARTGEIDYLRAISGLPYGESADEGLVRGNSFIHPKMGFAFDVPQGFKIQNSPQAVIAQNAQGATIIFDTDKKTASQPIDDYLFQTWSEQKGQNLERLTIDGKPAATAIVNQAQLNGKPVVLRMVAIDNGTSVYRFQQALPTSIAGNVAIQRELQASAQSFHSLSPAERNIQGQTVQVVAASTGDTVDSMASRMVGVDNPRALFMAINGIDNAQPLTAGRLYKVIR